MDTRRAEMLARSLMRQHGLTEWNFKYDGAKRRAGQCSYSNQTISLSRHLTALRTDEDVTDTILHEIAHALTPGAGHGPAWVRMARAIGCNGERCYTASEGERVPPNWIGICPYGHKVGKRYRRPRKGVRHSCGICNTRRVFDPQFEIMWVPADMEKEG